MKVALVSSSGGHLAQLLVLDQWWSEHERVWVTFDKPDSRSSLEDEQVAWAYHPTTRNLWNLLRNTLLALRLLRRERPDVIISTGAGVAVPFFVLGWLMRIPTVYLEVYDRIDTPTMTGRLCYPFSDLFLLQWNEQLAHYRRGIVIGRVL